MLKQHQWSIQSIVGSTKTTTIHIIKLHWTESAGNRDALMPEDWTPNTSGACVCVVGYEGTKTSV